MREREDDLAVVAVRHLERERSRALEHRRERVRRELRVVLVEEIDGALRADRAIDARYFDEDRKLASFLRSGDRRSLQERERRRKMLEHVPRDDEIRAEIRERLRKR